jgi:hypothetical protein
MQVLYRALVRRLGFVVGLLLLAPAPVLLAPARASAAESNIHAAYVKVALTWEKSTHRHPGFLMAIDEEGVFEIQVDGRTHAITVSFVEVGERVLTIAVKYEINGTTQWTDTLDVEAGTDTVLQQGKAKLTFNVDPQGSEDSSRDDEDKLDKPKNDKDDPLGGV